MKMFKKISKKTLWQIIAMIVSSAVFSGSGVLILAFINKYLLNLKEKELDKLIDALEYIEDYVGEDEEISGYESLYEDSQEMLEKLRQLSKVFNL